MPHCGEIAELQQAAATDAFARKPHRNLESLCREADLAITKSQMERVSDWNDLGQNLEVADLKIRA
jgi:hypothetical protein